MADGAVRSTSPKRQLDAPGEDSVAKRPRRPYKHHHSIRLQPEPTTSREPAFVNPDTVGKLLVDAIKTIVEEQGLQQEIYNPVIESLALEAFRNAVEECAVHRRS